MNARVDTHSFDLRAPYTIAYETITDAVNHFVTLEDSEGRCGRGCAAPAPEVTGEPVESSRAALDAFAAAINRGVPAHEALAAVPPGNPSARAAAETAILDLRGIMEQSPLYALLAGAARNAQSTDTREIARPISVTIGICGVDETVKLAARHRAAGFSVLKIKGGHDIRTDISRLRAVRDRIGHDATIALDANQGYTLDDVKRLSAEQPDLALAYLEQPTPRDDHALLARASSVSDVPVMADETVRSERDISMLIDEGGVDLINIKLQKVGGIGPALRIDEMAAGAGMPVMLGCMDESALSIAAALHFSEARPNVVWFDLDGHLDLIGDPFEGMLRIDAGVLTLRLGPGVGATSSA